MSTPAVVDLVIPGLSNLPVYEFASHQLAGMTPYLDKFLRFARHNKAIAPDLDHTLCRLLNLKQDSLPYAHAAGPPQASTRILFKPVYLQSDINNAIIFPVDIEDDILLIINDLKDYFKVDCDIESLADNSWLMTLHSIEPVKSMPHYLFAIGKKITHFLEHAREQMEWYKFLNELQMFLHQHPVNEQRQQAGKPVINSLWFWGAEPYRGEKTPGLHWFSDDPLMTRLGQLYTEQVRPLSEFKADKLLAKTVVVDLSLLKALKGESSKSLSTLLETIENRYFKPLLLSKRVQVNLHVAGELCAEYRPGMAFQFWKKKISLGDLLE